MVLNRPVAATLGTALLSSFALQAAAQDTQTSQKLYINPSIGYQLFDSKRDLDEAATKTIGAEFRFMPRWAVEAVYSTADADRKNAGGRSDLEEFRVDGLYYFADPDEKWNPYVSVGAGHADFDGSAPPFSAGTDHDETRVNAGVGVRYNVNETISLRGDLREFHGIDESTFDTVASVGISFGLGREVAAASDAPREPEPRPEPRDSDSDGVPDNRDQCSDTPRGASVDNRGCERDSDNDGVVNSKDECPDTESGAEVDEQGCVGEEEAVETRELSIQFPLESAEIDNRFDDELREVASFMEEHPQTVVEIAGHSDSTGPADYNQELSQRRAEAVAERLSSTLGVDSDRVSARGYGEDEPVADNDTPEGRAENRRVEARISERR